MKNVEPIEEFDVAIFFSIIEKMLVYEGEQIIVTMLDETEIKVVTG